jgi:hypothetical protein
MVNMGMEQPFERGESGSRSYLDHEAATSTNEVSKWEQFTLLYVINKVLAKNQSFSNFLAAF